MDNNGQEKKIIAKRLSNAVDSFPGKFFLALSFVEIKFFLSKY